MASISSASNHPDPDLDLVQSRGKRRKILVNDKNKIEGSASTSIDHTRWRTESEQRIYSSKLFQALRHINRTNNAGKAVRESADQVLADRAKGKTRWSRDIVTRRLTMRLNQINRIHRRAKPKKPIINPNNMIGEVNKNKKKVPVLEEKVSLLGRLVPGCRKLSLPNLLEETTDYIAALQMQVRAMTVLTELLTAGDPGVAPPAQPVGPPA